MGPIVLTLYLPLVTILFTFTAGTAETTDKLAYPLKEKLVSHQEE